MFGSPPCFANEEWAVSLFTKIMESLACLFQKKRGSFRSKAGAFLLLLLLSGCGAPSKSASTAPSKIQKGLSYTGLWVAPEDDKTSFELDLVQNGSFVEGYHAALVPETGNIEAALRTDRDPPSVRGQIFENGSVTVHFELRRSKGSGEAVLTTKGDKLKWKLISSSGVSALPKSCVLLRQTATEH